MDPRTLAERYFAAEAARDIPAVLDCFASGAVLEAGGQTWRGRDEIRRRYVAMAVEFPGLRVTVTDAVVDGDRGAVAWDAVLVGPDGREFPVDGVNLLTVADGRITRMRSYYDPSSLRV
jgi:uncharacterized protein (TIGR02246 family)